MSQNALALAPAPAPASPDSRDAAPTAPSQTPKTTAPSTERVLACVMCQQRKVKCNRKFPCNNCIRLGVSCVPATLNPRRRRRRFPERELLDRVRRYEALLRQNHVRFDSLFEETAGGPDPEKEDDSHDASQDASHDAASSLAALRQSGGSSRRRAVQEDEMMVDSDGDDAGPRLAVKTGSSDAGHSSVPPASSTAGHTPEQAPDAQSERRAEAINFWKAIRKGFYAPTTAGDGKNKNATPESSAAPAENNNNNDAPTHDDGNNSDSDASDEVRHSSAAMREMWARQLGSSGSLFFRGPHRTLGNVTAMHPDPVQIFRLWQIYLQNVDPLLKITHTPTLQGRIVEAASNLEGIDPTLEALLFAIYCVAVHSMTPSDCQATFGSSKDDLLITYQPACEQALLNAGFLRTSERDCLAAFFLYLISLGHSIDHRSLYSMLGVGMRVAQAMQINNELGPGSGIKLSPLEAEMRRRLWWAMSLFDARISELTNHSPTMLDPTWDCRLPLNANDFDFRPELKEPPVSASAAGGRGAVSSEALFAVVRSELGNAMRHMDYYLALSNPALKHMAKDREYVAQAQNAQASQTSTTTTHPRMPEFAEIYALEDMIHDKYLQYCDPANGLHFMTIWTAKGFIAKCRLIKFFSRYANGKASSSTNANTPLASTPTDNPSTPSAQQSSSSHMSPSEAMRDSALADALTVIESDSKIMLSPLTRRYRWLLHLYFPLPAYIFVTQELASRISGARATHAWAAMNDNYEARFALTDSEDRYMFKMFASTILLAWNACKARSRAAGEPQPARPPEMILRVQKHLEEAKQASESENQEAAPDVSSFNPDSAGTDVGDPVPGVMGGGFATSLSMDLGQPGGGLTGSLFGGGPPGSGPPSVNASAFGGATPPAPPLFPGLNLDGGLGFGMGNMGNWLPMPMPWSWGPRPNWGG